MYLVADESWSMADDPTALRGPTPIAALSDTFLELRDVLAVSPLLAEMAFVGVITFAGDAVCRRVLAPLRDDDQLPDIHARGGGTSYGAAFTMLRDRLAEDVGALRAEGYEVHRPVVFFITDGLPTDPEAWPRALADVRKQFRPTVIAFGIGGADHDVIADVASSPEYAFVAGDTVSPAEAAVAFASSLMASVTATAASVAAGDAELRFVRPRHFEELGRSGEDRSDVSEADPWYAGDDGPP